MNLFKFLKSTSGKIVLRAPQLLTIGGVGALAVYGAYQTDNTFASKEAPIRTLSSISSGSSYEGLQSKDGLLTSINIKDSLNQVATAEERAALEAGSGSANNFGLDNVDNIQNISFGSAAETSSTTDGLGMGANRAVLNGPAAAGASGGRQVPGVSGGAVSAAAAHQAAHRPSLGTASMARASGNAFNAASGAIGGSSASGSGGSGSSGQSGSGSEGYQFSGAMPSGSNAVSAMGLSRSGSGFMAGGRNATTAANRRSFRDSNDLRDISKRSADAARNENRAANEGSRAFLASSRNSGGMTVEGGVETESTGSADFENPANAKLKAIGNWVEQEDDFAEKQEKARKRLMWMTLALIAATVAAIPAAYHLISKGKMLMLNPLTAAAGAPLVAWGWVILGIVMAYAATVVGFGVNYQKNYNGNLMPIMSYLVSAGAIGALIWTGISAMKTGAAGDKTAQKTFMSKATGALKKVGMMGATKGGEVAVQQIKQHDAEVRQQSSNK